MVSSPDKDFTFDRQRDLTTFEHLLTDYQQSITEVTDEHYMDFLRHVHPAELFTGKQEIG